MSKYRPWIIGIAVSALVLFLATPAKLEPREVDPLPYPESLIPGTEERIILLPGDARSEWVVLAIHGYSASRQETAPLAELVASELGANLVEARLTGHGHKDKPLADTTAEHWLADARRVLTAAAEIGDKIIVIGTSTGATLAAAMLDQPSAEPIDTLVMISPNFLPQAAGAQWLTRPFGRQLAYLLAGETRCWEPHNEQQEKYWSTCAPTAAAVEMMRLVDRARRVWPTRMDQRLLVFYSADDQVVAPEATLDAYAAVEARDQLLVEVTNADDPSDHVLAGEILSPGTTRQIADEIVAFIRRPAR